MAIKYYNKIFIPGSPPATEIPASPIEYHNLPSNLISFLGNPTHLRRIENDRTIVLYVLSAGDENSAEKTLLNNLFDDLKQYCQCRGFELQLCDLYEVSEQFLDPQRWKTEPANKRGGYHLLAEYLAAITSNYAKYDHSRSSNNFNNTFSNFI